MPGPPINYRPTEAETVREAFSTCFAAGTGIATFNGERAVETLEIGDLMTTADGRTMPLKWIGRQTVHRCSCRRSGA